jgi:DNA replication protein DnaC
LKQETNFSGLADLKREQEEMFKPTAEVCEIHDVPLVQYQDRQAFCPECASERVEQDDYKLREVETEKAQNVNKRWLKQRSIVLDRDMFKMTFDNYDAVDEETKRNKEKALNIARSLYKGSKSNEMLAGMFGTGKTHLAMAILNQLNQFTDMKLLFVSMDVLVRRIRANMGDKESPYEEERVIYLLSKADVLVLDDLGAEVGSIDRASEATDFVVRIINGVLNGRANKPTILTTNLSIGELNKIYDGRIVSRMLEDIEEERFIIFKETSDKRIKIKF